MCGVGTGGWTHLPRRRRERLTEAEWIQRIAQATGWKGEIITLSDKQMPAHLRKPYDFSQDWSLDSSRIREELGYVEPTPPDIAMECSVAWQRANPHREFDPAAFDYAAEDTALTTVRAAVS